MSDVLANVLIAYVSVMTVGFGGLFAATAAGPIRLVVFAITLAMAAAPYSQAGGPRW